MKDCARSLKLGLLFGIATLSCHSFTNAQDTSRLVQSLASPIVPEELRKTVSNQLLESLRTKIKAANAKSTEEWNGIQSLAGWEKFRRQKLSALKASLGTWPEPPNPLRMRVSSTLQGDGFAIDNLLYESRPRWWVSANLYRPQTNSHQSMPGILLCHAHHTPKEHGELQDMGMTWARAGCYVLVIDQVGHGERRQHPFAKASDFDRPFRVGHADYYFRYDNAIQLQLIGESLIGWMVWDLMRGVDLLLTQPNIDPKRLILLGAVAGGGDPAAVAGALDERLAAVVPFNFGGPQPETKYPLPDDAETSFNYAGGGSWESTRNLDRSAADGFLPWTIVGSIAPRKLIYAHEFNWDQERDPVWKRLSHIYDWYEKPSSLSWTNGRGSVSGSTKEDTHCTHIGRVHRTRIHEAFERWFQISSTSEKEYSSRLQPEQLQCWTPELKTELNPSSLSEMVREISRQKSSLQRKSESTDAIDALRIESRKRWASILNLNEIASSSSQHSPKSKILSELKAQGITAISLLVTPNSETQIPVRLFTPDNTNETRHAIVIICSQGATRFQSARANQLARLLDDGHPICLFDPRNIGECSSDSNRGRRSASTSMASTALMLRSPILGQQLEDVLSVLNWLTTQAGFHNVSFEIRGESLLPANEDAANFRCPRDDDSQLPPVSEPQAALLALLAGLFDDRVTSIHTSGGLVSWMSLLDHWLVLTPYESVIPGSILAGDIQGFVNAQRQKTKITIENSVDGRNRLSPNAQSTSTPSQ